MLDGDTQKKRYLIDSLKTSFCTKLSPCWSMQRSKLDVSSYFSCGKAKICWSHRKKHMEEQAGREYFNSRVGANLSARFGDHLCETRIGMRHPRVAMQCIYLAKRVKTGRLQAGVQTGERRSWVRYSHGGADQRPPRNVAAKWTKCASCSSGF